jgi:uncharacterized protein YjiS (DUF1127 family)
MWLTHRLSNQAPYTLAAGSEALIPPSASSLNVAMNVAYARSKPVETALGQDLSDILEDLGRQGPFGLFRVWRERWRYRKELARLFIVGPYMINDIGLTLDQALAEVDRPFWRR